MQLKSFFSKLFYISLILILLGILISIIKTSNPTLNFIIDIASKVIESIGISILIANIFSFIIGTENFLEYIRDRLVKIVISKEFISKLSQGEQKSMLRMVLKPTRELSNMYSGINDYFSQYIDESINLFKKSYRGHMSIDAVASYNKELEKVQIEFDLDLITYKIDQEFEPIKLSLEDESYKLLEVVISGKGGEHEKIDEETIQNIIKPTDAAMNKSHEIPIPSKFNDLKQIKISMKIIEYGTEHWQIFSFKNAKPCDQLLVVLRCEDDLIIKEEHTYGVEQKFSIDKTEKKIRVAYNDWLSPGFGVNIMVARNDYHK
jgi:hypothetical protein